MQEPAGSNDDPDAPVSGTPVSKEAIGVGTGQDTARLVEMGRPNAETADSVLSTADIARDHGTADGKAQPNNGQTGGRLAEAASVAGEDPAVLTPLLGADEATEFRSRWGSVQGRFVDDPRHAVQDADELVAAAIQRMAQVFADERADLERQWDGGGDVSTEDLRQSLQRYRAFFQRLLAA